MTEENYNAQKVLYNLTLQHTVASTLAGVTPDRVTNIVVGPPPAARQSSKLSALAVVPDACSLKYTVTVRDPLLLLPELTAQLQTAVASKEMDANLQVMAATFGVTNLANGTFSVPLLSSAGEGRTASSQLTGVQIAGLVIGVVLFVALLTVLVLFLLASREKHTVPPVEASMAETA